MRVATKLVLNLTVSALALPLAQGARADSFYQPYYYNRDNIQFANIAPPLQVIPPQPESSAAQQATVARTDNYQFAVTDNANSAPYVAPVIKAPVLARGIDAIRGSDNAVWLSTGASFLNYKEALSPMTDGERGWLPSFAAGASYMNPNNWYFVGEGSISFGDAPYNGALENIQTGQETPYSDWTHETVINVDGKVGKGFALNDNSMLIPYGELGMRFWDRDIKGAYGYVEDYSQFDALGGLMFQITPIDRLILSAYGSYGLTFAGKMNTQATDLHLGSAGMYKVGGKVSYALTPRIDLFTTLDFDHFRNVNSGEEPDYEIGYYIMEPSSFTNETTTRIGVAYRY
ncbi:MAG: hypothetical protein P4M13_05610 [Alphaproteobacteria bacterium]|nr:hypothetical protein [Alphaproteobacteria bacterium]